MYKGRFLEEFKKKLAETGEVGYVQMVSPALVYADGLPNVKVNELVIFETGALGQVLSLEKNLAGILMFSDELLEVGKQVTRSGELLSIPVGPELVGRIVDPLCHALYDTQVIENSKERYEVVSAALGIEVRQKIDIPLETGVTLVDMMVPLGRGQRELVIGDRKTGKSAFLLQTMLTQATQGVLCIYAAIGKKKVDIREIELFCENNGIKDKTILVASSSSDPLGLIHLTPYSAMAMAEYFRDSGRDVLLILDDLTTHAKFYREVSLLNKRFPGRSSYPGDIFYTHASLLERAGNFKTSVGVKSITCLPVASTMEGDISGYIQTNLMSITDGHIYFDKDLFDMGRRPAISHSLSVTRVGRQTQSKLRWSVNRELNSFFALHEKVQSFVHFGAELNEGIKATLRMGDVLTSFFDQGAHMVIDLNVQLLMFGVIWIGTFKDNTSVELKTGLETATKLYTTNKKFKLLVDDLVTSAKDLNDLLGKIGMHSQEIITYIGMDLNVVSAADANVKSMDATLKSLEETVNASSDPSLGMQGVSSTTKDILTPLSTTEEPKNDEVKESGKDA